MKYFTIPLCFLLFYSCSKKESNVVTPTTPSKEQTSVKNSTISLQVPGISPSEIGSAVNGSVSGTTLYTKEGVEHLIISPTLFFNEPLIPAIHLIKKNNEWVYESSYSEGAMGAGRDSEIFDNVGSIVFADHGLELRQGTWPNGHIMLAETNGERLVWTTISTDRSFYHSISTGDLNNDGLRDIIGLNMGTKGTWYDNLHPYLQKSDGTFEATRTLVSYNNWPGAYGGGAVLVANVWGDTRPEIIRADYGINPSFPSPRYSFAIFSYSTQTNKYEYIKGPGVYGFATQNLGATSMRAVDFDNDGDLDIALAFEGSQTNGVEIWLNNGNADYVATNSRLEYTFNDLQFREFEVGDIDGDGWQDIILNPVNGNLFKSANAGNGELYLHNLIWKNNKGIFEKLSKEQKITFAQLPTYLKSFVINNKLKFIGIRGNLDGALIITEINPVF